MSENIGENNAIQRLANERGGNNMRTLPRRVNK